MPPAAPQGSPRPPPCSSRCLRMGSQRQLCPPAADVTWLGAEATDRRTRCPRSDGRPGGAPGAARGLHRFAGPTAPTPLWAEPPGPSPGRTVPFLVSLGRCRRRSGSARGRPRAPRGQPGAAETRGWREAAGHVLYCWRCWGGGGRPAPLCRAVSPSAGVSPPRSGCSAVARVWKGGRALRESRGCGAEGPAATLAPEHGGSGKSFIPLRVPSGPLAPKARHCRGQSEEPAAGTGPSRSPAGAPRAPVSALARWSCSPQAPGTCLRTWPPGHSSPGLHGPRRVRQPPGRGDAPLCRGTPRGHAGSRPAEQHLTSGGVGADAAAAGAAGAPLPPGTLRVGLALLRARLGTVPRHHRGAGRCGQREPSRRL